LNESSIIEVAFLLHRSDVIKTEPVFEEITNHGYTGITQIFLFMILNPIWLGLNEEIEQGDFFDKLFNLRYSQRIYECYSKLKGMRRLNISKNLYSMQI
jgi:hypothetical protein